MLIWILTKLWSQSTDIKISDDLIKTNENDKIRTNWRNLQQKDIQNKLSSIKCLSILLFQEIKGTRKSSFTIRVTCTFAAIKIKHQSYQTKRKDLISYFETNLFLWSTRMRYTWSFKINKDNFNIFFNTDKFSAKIFTWLERAF